MTAPVEPGNDPGNDPGGDPENPVGAGGDPGNDPGGDPAKAPEQLGDSGKKAIDAMKRERDHAKRELSGLQKKLKEFTDKDKSEVQRLQESSEEAKTRAATAEQTYRKMQVALDYAPEGASLAHIKMVAKRLSGDSDEELQADANEMFGLFAPKAADQPAKKQIPSKPKENLRGGGDPDEEPEETDPSKLAELIGRHQ